MNQNNLEVKIVQIRRAANAAKELAERIGKIGDLSMATEDIMNEARDKIERAERMLRCLFLAGRQEPK